MKRTLIVLFGLMLWGGLNAQTRTIKYWFDNNDGQSVTTSFSGNVWDTELDASQFNDGFHVLHYQLSDTTLSPIKSYLFHKISTIENSNQQYFYWFDNQYSNMQSGTLGNGILSLGVENIPAGFHSLHLMLKNDNYSSTKSYLFIKTEMADLGVNLHYHCWFDEDFDHQQTGMLGDGNLLLDVTALADGEHVVRFYLEGSTVAATQSYVFMKGEGGETYEITATAVPAGAGTVTGAGTYYVNNTCTLVAIPNNGCAFKYWMENGNVVSEEAAYTFTVTGNRDLVAQFSGTGVDENEGEGFVLFPNPVNDKLIIESNSDIRSCEIYSLTGQLMLSLTNDSERLEIPAEKLSAGVYLVKLVTENAVQTKKFVKE